MNQKRLFIVATLLLFSAFISNAQDRPIGYWREHLPYGSAVGIATDGRTIYTATNFSFFTYDLVSGEMTPYSKIDGMADIQMSCIGYDATTQTAVLCYQNSNIDLFRNHSFYGLPDLKLKAVTGSKNINAVYTEAGYAYLSTDLGVVVINLNKEEGEIKETYTFNQNGQQVPVTNFGAQGNYFYAATPGGLFRADKNNSNLQNVNSWQLIGSGKSLTCLAFIQNRVYATGTDSLYILDSDSLKYVLRTNNRTRHLDTGTNALYFSLENGAKVVKMDLNYNALDSISFGLLHQVLEITPDNVWVADEYSGLSKLTSESTYSAYAPPGPIAATAPGLYAENKNFWIALGSYNDLYQPVGNTLGIASFKDETWKNYTAYNFPPFYNDVSDFIVTTKNPVDGSIWYGSLRSGLFILKPDGSYVFYNHGSQLEPKEGDTTTIAVNSIAADEYGNMWFTQHGSKHELAAIAQDGTWYHFSTPYLRVYPHGAAGLVIDNSNQKWFYAPNQNAIIVYNDNYTIDNTADDKYIFLSGLQSGIAGSRVLCMTKDKNGNIWVGTDDGISIFSCADQVLQGTCIGERRIVQYDQFAGYLFQTEQVNTIAVDGANRKWVGTNNGVWLISPEGDKVIYRFTIDNSPLPSNTIQNISVDGVTGDVYISTEYGIMSYRSTATDGGTVNSNVLVFPNPVPSGYKGTIAIRGLVENADVRITDISGQLVYRTTALGGQAVWNGVDYKGHRPQSGVYLIFISNKDGSQTNVSKMVFME
ncbi:type IX secretion system anionic LPS delivery protein PorZ [Taibaiella soli]|nr:two-component regulator propeller domain-containing protein [Taibaiella soli]